MLEYHQGFGIHLFEKLHGSNLYWLNSANVVLLPKKEGAEGISDYRPISLIHAIVKIIAKILANRHRPHMDSIVSNTQSAFIKGRSIHDNFMHVRNLARRLHKNKMPSLLFKLDIRKTFDSVKWEYLIDLLQRKGFPSKFRNWITALLVTSSSRILLNGVHGTPIHHGKGLRQGDLLSPLLFVIGHSQWVAPQSPRPWHHYENLFMQMMRRCSGHPSRETLITLPTFWMLWRCHRSEHQLSQKLGRPD